MGHLDLHLDPNAAKACQGREMHEVFYLRATLRSIGIFGMVLVLAVVGTLLWVLFDQGMINLDNPTVNTWIAIVALSVVLAIGLSWSIVRRKLSGQADIDDADE